MLLDQCAKPEIVFCVIGRWVGGAGRCVGIWVAGAYGMASRRITMRVVVPRKFWWMAAM